MLLTCVSCLFVHTQTFIEMTVICLQTKIWEDDLRVCRIWRGVCTPAPLAGMSRIATRLSRRPSNTLMHHFGTQAYVLYSRSDAGVPRGMACIAAFLLAVLGPSREEDTFWIFAGLLENRVPRSCVLEVSTLALIPIFKCSSKARKCTLTAPRWYAVHVKDCVWNCHSNVSTYMGAAR